MSKKNMTIKFPKGFFASIKSCPNGKNAKEADKPFAWSKNVLNKTARVKIIKLKNK